MNRKNFETLFLILYKKWKKWEKQTSAYGVGWDIWQEQQKKIDELNLQIESKIRACDDCSVRFSNEIDALKALNPDVPCPVCGGKGGWYNETAIPEYVPCYLCNGKGKVSLTKAQEYRIEQLEATINRMVEEAR